MTQTPQPRDAALGGTDQPVSADQGAGGTEAPPSPFGNPEGPTASAAIDLAAKPVRQFTISEVLSTAKLQHRTARVCLRADLQGRYDAIMAELSTLVTPQGVVLENVADESLAGNTSAGERAQRLNDEAREVRREMLEFMWHVEFRAMPDDEWVVWHKAHFPGGENPDLREYNNKLIAACAVEPTMTVDEVKQLRGVLGTPQMIELANKAWECNAQGGLDIPKSPLSLRNPAAGR